MGVKFEWTGPRILSVLYVGLLFTLHALITYHGYCGVSWLIIAAVYPCPRHMDQHEWGHHLMGRHLGAVSCLEVVHLLDQCRSLSPTSSILVTLFLKIMVSSNKSMLHSPDCILSNNSDCGWVLTTLIYYEAIWVQDRAKLG